MRFFIARKELVYEYNSKADAFVCCQRQGMERQRRGISVAGRTGDRQRSHGISASREEYRL